MSEPIGKYLVDHFDPEEVGEPDECTMFHIGHHGEDRVFTAPAPSPRHAAIAYVCFLGNHGVPLHALFVVWVKDEAQQQHYPLAQDTTESIQLWVAQEGPKAAKHINATMKELESHFRTRR